MSDSCDIQKLVEMKAGDLIKTDLCPAGLAWDIQILNAFQVHQRADGSIEPHVHSMETFFGTLTGRSPKVTRYCTYVVFSQKTITDYPAQPRVMERLSFAEMLEKYHGVVYKEPTLEDLQDKMNDLVYERSKKPTALFASEEAYKILYEHTTKVGTGPAILTYDGIDVYEVPKVQGFQLWAGYD